MNDKPIVYTLDANEQPVGIQLSDVKTDRSVWPRLKTDIGDYRVSTIFLTVDHNFEEGPPVLWETVVFSGKGHSVYEKRYTSGNDARRGHNEAIAWVIDRFS